MKSMIRLCPLQLWALDDGDWNQQHCLRMSNSTLSRVVKWPILRTSLKCISSSHMAAFQVFKQQGYSPCHVHSTVPTSCVTFLDSATFHLTTHVSSQHSPVDSNDSGVGISIILNNKGWPMESRLFCFVTDAIGSLVISSSSRNLVLTERRELFTNRNGY